MTSRLSMFSTGHSRGRRASVAEVIRHATTNSGLSRVFARIKSVPHLNSNEPSPLLLSNGITAHTGLQDPNSAANQDYPLLIISPPTGQSPSRDMNIELGALGIIFPQSPSSNDGGFSPTPPIGTDAISKWVEFFAQSENNRRREHSVAEPESVIGTTESTDGMATPFGAATSSMTLMDPEVCSPRSTPREEEEEGRVCIGTLERDQDLRLIGDEVVLKYILDGMGPFEEPCLSLGIQEESKIDFGYEIGPKADADTPSAFALTIPFLEKALPELRHRKDPKYDEPPSISLITATPQCTIGERHEYFATPPSTSSTVTLLTPCYSRNNLSYPTVHQCQSDTRGNFTDLRPGPNAAYVCGSYDSIFLESDFAITRHASSSSFIPAELTVAPDSEPSLGGLGPTNDHLNEHTTSPTVFDSLMRKLGVGIYSIFRFGRSAAKEEIKPDEASKNRSQVEGDPNNERRLYSLQSALDISLPIGES